MFAFIEGWPYLRGGFKLIEHSWDIMKCPWGGLYEGFHCSLLEERTTSLQSLDKLAGPSM